VEDGRPFCPNCRAPQVRVEMTSLPSIAIPVSHELPIHPDQLGQAGIRSPGDPAFFRTALQAGLLGVMANLIPFGLGMVLTGILAALLYHRARSGNLRPMRAARLGAVAGAIAFATIAILSAFFISLLNLRQQFHDLMLKTLEQSVANQAGPDVQSFLDLIHTAQGFEIALALGMAGAVFLSMLFSAVGGVIGSTLFRDRNQPPF
jgi:hypothetical protein